MSYLNRDQSGKPIAPRKDWPMTANGNGQWSKKHKGRVYYFGAWDAWRDAEQSYGRRWPSIFAGLGDPDAVEAAPGDPVPVVRDFEALVTLWLEVQKQKLASFKIEQAHYGRIRKELTMILDFVPPKESTSWRHRLPDKFKPLDWGKLQSFLEDHYGVDARKHTIGLVRSVARFSRENDYSGAWEFGNALPLPSKGDIRMARNAQDQQHGEKMFPREQIKPILDACNMPLDAMFLLALNAGFTSADCSELPMDALDLDNQWFDYCRVKTGIQRRGFLWNETVAALRMAIKHRPAVNVDKWQAAVEAWKARKPQGREALKRWERKQPRWDRLVFITRCGTPWRKERVIDAGTKDERTPRYDAVLLEFRKVLERLDVKHPKGLGGLSFKRGRVNFGAGRHTFWTSAKCLDAEAAQYVMGHADQSMGSWYGHLNDAKMQRLLDLSETLHERLLTQANTAVGFRFRALRLRGMATGNAAASA